MTAENKGFQPPFTSKESILKALMIIFKQWDECLNTFDASSAEKTLPESDWAVKDVAAHLMAWQQVTNARVQAAVDQLEPVFPDWLAGSSLESEEEIDVFNTLIKQQYQAFSWAEVYQMWYEGFVGILEAVEEIP